MDEGMGRSPPRGAWGYGAGSRFRSAAAVAGSGGTGVAAVGAVRLAFVDPGPRLLGGPLRELGAGGEDVAACGDRLSGVGVRRPGADVGLEVRHEREGLAGGELGRGALGEERQ